MTSPAGNESTFIHASGHGEDAGIFEDTTLAIKFTISTNNCEDLSFGVVPPLPFIPVGAMYIVNHIPQEAETRLLPFSWAMAA